jgi:hypothetical protein
MKMPLARHISNQEELAKQLVSLGLPPNQIDRPTPAGPAIITSGTYSKLLHPIPIDI